jgi:hypothetical protein
MIELGTVQLLLFLASILLVGVAMALIALSRSDGVTSTRQWIRPGAGISGFLSGACLGAAAAWRLPAATLALVSVAGGLVLGMATATISRQVAALTSPDRRRSGEHTAPQQPAGTGDDAVAPSPAHDGTQTGEDALGAPGPGGTTHG